MNAEFHPLQINLTFRNVSGWGGLLIKAVGNINNCHLTVDGKQLQNALFPNMQTLLEKI
jgi:hypothetical protein